MPLIPQLPQIPKEGCGWDNKRDECEGDEEEGFGGPLETVNDISDPPACSSCECGCNLTGHCRSCGDDDDDDDDDGDDDDDYDDDADDDDNHQHINTKNNYNKKK